MMPRCPQGNLRLTASDRRLIPDMGNRACLPASVTLALKRVAFERIQGTRFEFLFMHVVLAKPLRTLGSSQGHALARHASGHFLLSAKELGCCFGRMDLGRE
ncbi:hypothetical protein MESS2_440061 [Mesorhizobium metallidurans STM 2683]|uniref:Uncharacterized protein n=1 Tax=Mesorhizobium metallidurans STM 2683 TaxID=1297569 RepID=M5F501_9HYPH|nr:hypothetical protein MESS2_440061 [Mesorhizobium metallidurans STM 2683]